MWLRMFGSGIIMAALIGVQGSDLAAQQAGTVTGQVTDAQTLAPLASVQISIGDLSIGGLTQANGRFLLINVPAGTHTLTAQRIGYRTATQTITVAAGGTVTANFQITEEALSLSEIIVTGTPGGTQRRAIGNDVARVDLSQTLEAAPTVDVQGVLKSRAPGLSILPGGGEVGGGGSIRIRGNSSFTLSNEPIVYIDGVRMDAASYGGNRPRNPINEIDPETIASVEIIKGPAAATLYGTEASGGVIQILTKRGASGAPVVDVSSQLGVHYNPNPAERYGYSYYRATLGDPNSELLKLNLYEYEEQNGRGPLFQNGLLQSYNASITGGTENIRYYAGIGADDNMGTISNDYQYHTMYNGRLNLGATLSPTLNVDFSLGIVRNNIKEVGTSTFQHFTAMVWAQPRAINGANRGFQSAPPEAMDLVDIRQQIDRTTGSMQISHKPKDWFTHRLTVGVDNRNNQSFTLYPRQPDTGINGDGQRFFSSLANGSKTVQDQLNTLVTADYAFTVDVDLNESINSQTSVGGQYYQKKVLTRGATGLVFPTAVVTTISGAATTFGSEDFLENVTAGAYVQQQFGWRDRIFVTGAVRMDDNSAFGENFDAAVYPKFSATWVVSEESFFDFDAIDQLRLRTAWGASGKQPDIFAAQRFYNPSTGPGGASVLTPGTIGNPDLKPEVSKELEVGLDVALFDQRVSANVTQYWRRTEDAILDQNLPTSAGFPGSQSINAGEVKAWGTEVQVNADIITGSSFGWSTAVSWSRMKNEVVDLGPLASVGTGNRLSVEGYGLGDLWWREVVSASYSGTGSVTGAMCRASQDDYDTIVPCGQAEKVWYGHTYPQWELGVENNFTIGRSLRLSARVDAQGGHWGVNHDHLATAVSFSNTIQAVTPRTYPIFDSYRSLVGRDPIGFFKRDFGKLRTVSATYTLPESVAGRVGASRASVTVAGDNLWTFWFPGRYTTLRNTDEPLQGPDNTKGGPEAVWDPEMEPAGSVLAGNFLAMMPPTRRFTTTLRLSF